MLKSGSWLASQLIFISQLSVWKLSLTSPAKGSEFTTNNYSQHVCLDIKNKNKNISVLNEFKMYVYNSVWPSQIKIQYLSFTTKIVFSRSNQRNQQKKKDLQLLLGIDLIQIHEYLYVCILMQTRQKGKEGDRRECFDSKLDFWI